MEKKRKWFYERADQFLESPVNKTFEEVLWMTDEQFADWTADVRKTVIDIWDNQGQPPRVGLVEKDIKEQFRAMSEFNVKGFLVKDELTDETNVIRNTSIIGNAANQWFPTMMATRINYTSDVHGGLSIYDHFKKPELLKKMITYGRRHFKRDSFYHYSNPLRVFDPSWTKDKRNEYLGMFLFIASDAIDWITRFEKDYRKNHAWDYWIQPIKDSAEYSGYGGDLTSVRWHKLTRKQIEDLGDLIPDKCKTVMNDVETDTFQVRPFKLGQKIFPLGIKAYRISVCQYAVNFPPLTARFLYERYLGGKDEAIVWDPSAGWGGRILGAMSVNNDNANGVKKLHYIGTDPNTDHNTTPGRTKYHELADFYNKTKPCALFEEPKTHTYEIYQCGSEVMKDQPDFQKYKGKLDLVFTSPPYFAKELYSEDAGQSAIKFNTYQTWVVGFLKPTLETAAEWLKPGGYILWNIADAKFGNQMLPLEGDSRKIMEDLGLEYVETMKMALAQMPGGNRIDTDDGTPMAKNFCKLRESGAGGKGVGGRTAWFKYEPIFVYRKI